MLNNEYFIKWLFGLGGAGVTAILTYIWHKVKKGYSLLKEEDKEEFLKDVNDRITEDENKMETLKKENELSDKKLNDKINSVVDVLDLLKEGILSLHLDSLIQESKFYIGQGWISVDALERFEEKYKLYKRLGGNGHMESWLKKIRKLPNVEK